MSSLSRYASLRHWYARISWWRMVAARRVASVLLLLFAGILTLRAQLHPGEGSIIVAAHNLTPGTALVATDLATKRAPLSDIPSGALSRLEQLVGRTVTGPIRGGEIMTDARVITPRLAELTLHQREARAVPVPLSDPAVAGMLRPGDRVDIVTVPPRHEETTQPDSPLHTPRHQPQVLVRDAIVILIAEPNSMTRSTGHTALLAMAGPAAQQVAATILVQNVTLIVR